MNFFLGKDKILKNELIGEIRKQFTQFKNDTLFLRADYGMTYGKVAGLMSTLKAGGVLKIALVTEIKGK